MLLAGAREPPDTLRERGRHDMATVLIVDDDTAIRQAVRATLEFTGHRVREATDGVEALAELRAAPLPLVVLVDLRMPTMDGFTLLKLVAEEPALADRHAYVIFTADASSLPVVQALRAQTIVASLPKPFELEALLQAVEEAAHLLPPALTEAAGGTGGAADMRLGDGKDQQG
jgi:CheY-like chemotaxis protein